MAQGRKATISIVIPIYNGENYLRKTLDSVLAQSFEDFEVICADDCSTDGSREIVKEYAARDKRIRGINSPCNLGAASKAINFAVPSVSGDFFVYSSQDDLHSSDWLAKMHQKSIETGADAVVPDVMFYYENEPSRNWSMIGFGGDRQAQLTGRDALVQSLDWRIAGNALWNMAIIRKLGFKEFAANSDEYSVRRFFLHCNKVVFSEGTFYYRQDNENAITKKKSPSSFDWPYTQLRLVELLQEHSFPTDLMEREISGATAAMKELEKWLEANRQCLTTKEADLMGMKVKRFEERLASHHLDLLKQMERQSKRANGLAAKWNRSLTKLPAKVVRLLGRPWQGNSSKA